MRILGLTLLGAALLALTGQPLQAQPQARTGFWWGFGLGHGWVRVSCDICEGSRGTGWSGTGRLGGTVSRWVRLGAELNGWTRSEAGVDEFLGSVSAVAYWYPSSDGPWFVHGGLGYVTYRIEDSENTLTSSGLGPHFGAGREFRVTSSISAAPYVNALLTPARGTLDFNGNQQAEGVSLWLIQLGLGFTWH